MTTRGQARSSGVALLLVLGVLAVLALLAAGFVRLMHIERLTSSNYQLKTRARLAAQAGIWRAIEELRQMARKEAYTSLKDRWVYKNDLGTGVGLGPLTRLESASFPSFPFDRDKDGGFENGVGGTSSDDLVYGRAVSGILPDETALEPGGLSYTLRIVDCASQINLNGVQPRMAEILDALGRAIAAETAFPDPVAGAVYKSAVTASTHLGGDAIVQFRKDASGGTLSSKAAIQALLGTDGSGVSHYDRLRDYITVHSWRDPDTVRPQPRPTMLPYPKPETEPRFPVNINTAPYPVLRASLVGLAGYETKRVSTGGNVEGEEWIKVATASLTETQADHVARKIIAYRASATGPLRTWQQVYDFLDTLVGATPAPDASQIATIKANSNPNTGLNRFSPDGGRSVPVDKFDLTAYSTEFCFASMGFYEIASLGRVTALGGQVQTSERIDTVVRLYNVFRHTTQRQFEEGRVVKAPGGLVSLPESIPDMKSTSSPTDDSGTSADGWLKIDPDSPVAHHLTGASPYYFAPFGATFVPERVPGATDFPGALGDAKVGYILDPKEQDQSVLVDSELLRDGQWSINYKGECNYFNFASGNVYVTEGTLEFWHRFDKDLYAFWTRNPVIHYHHEGQVGRFGGAGHITQWFAQFGKYFLTRRIFATAISPYEYVYTSNFFELKDWKPRQWHHIAIKWSNTMEHDLYVDGVKATLQTKIKTVLVIGKRTFYIKFLTFPSKGMEKIFAGDIITSTKENGYALRWHPNSTFDDLKVYRSKDLYTTDKFPAPSRYRVNPVIPPRFEGKFVSSELTAVELGTISWTAWMPRGWSASTYPKDTFKIDAAGRTGSESAFTALSGGDGSGTPILDKSGSNKVLASADSFHYRLTVTNPGGVTPLMVSPVIDDVTVTYLPRDPEILSWSVSH